MAYEPRIIKPREIVTVVPGVVPSVVGEPNIADNAVTSPKIKDETIRTEDIGAGQVQESDIMVNAITTEKIATGAVTTEKIKDSAVTNVKLASNSVDSLKIIDGSVTTPKIDNGAVTAEKLGNDVVIGTLGDGSVTTQKLADGAVTNPKIATNAVTTAKIATSAVTKIKLASNSVGYLEIINGSVEPRHIRAVDSPANGEVPSYNQAQQRFEWVAPGGVSRPLTPPVATGEIADGAVTKAKLSYKVITIVIPAGQVGGLFPPLGDPDLNGGVILGYSIPVNQDQLIRQLFLLPGLPSGTAVSILLSAPAIVDNTFNVVVLR